MDFFDSITASETGALLHLTNMRTGYPAYVIDAKGVEDKAKPIRIKFLGPDSAALKDKARKRTVSVVKQRAVGMDMKKMSEAQITGLLSEGEEATLQSIVEATVTWENISLDGKPVEFSAETAMDLYTRYPSIAEEAATFIGSRANFFDQA
jgi:hypothetical protein